MTVPQAQVLGLTPARPRPALGRRARPLRLRRDRLGRVLRGDQGPRPVQRRAAWPTLRAHDEGAWVREAADGLRRQARRARRGGRVMVSTGSTGEPTGAGRHRDWPLWEVFVRARRGLSHVHVGSLHAPDAEMALRNARDLYTRRGEGVSLWVVPSRRHRPPRPPTSATRSSTPPPTRSTATRRSTTSPKGCSTCEHPPSLGRRVRARPRRRRPGARPAPGLVDQPRPELEEDVALANIALDLLGQARALLALRRSARGRRAHRGRPGLPARRARVPQRAARRAARRATSAVDDGAPAAVRRRTSAHLYRRLCASTDETLAGVAAKAVKEVDYHGDHASSGCCASATAPTSRTAGCRPRSRPMWPYVDELFEAPPVIRGS